MSDNIKVVVKVRPLISREIEEKLSYQWRVKNNTLYQLDQNGKDLGQSFTFDKVYDKDTKTSDVYNDIAKPIVQAATAGFNGTIFAYGQTSSGKTYTMTGTESSPGIIPLAVLNLFEIIKSVPDRDFLVRVSYIEIYNETVKDLLNVEKENIKVHETLQGIKVDASEKVTSSPEEVLEIMKEGEANRQMGATNMNEKSSRSHSIFQITIESREHTEGDSEGGCVNVSQLNLVDLAGSERAGQTGATGIRFKEGTHINKSLSALALVIKQLSEDPNKYANYRDSKLTRILQNSLGGNAKTSIICAVTPAAVEETISTLQFANRAKAIKNKPEVNAVATDATMIQRLTKQMSKLQAQLESKKNLEQDNYNLQKQITALQRLILNGFAARRSADLPPGARRRLHAPRRVTIHSTLASDHDEPALSVPKFCTPSLKYNPLSIPTPSTEFVPVQSGNKLESVPEEPPRLLTPPRRAVNFSDEVIELDSDDDSVHGDHETCSPIHKCYGSSKTPPCILRKNAKLAEKNLRDIVELTEREKIYSPSTVELMEKLEQNSTVIAKLQDDIETLNKRSKDKELEVDVLKSKIKEHEDELKALTSAKADLQMQCDNYSTKLTDWEVSYETLRNKAKLREEELLSLLDEVKVKKTEEIGKILSRTLDKDMHFMDMSKDISLVNSDNENSIFNPDDINNIVSNTSMQLASTNLNNVELEANLFAHKQKIVSLENLTHEFEQTISTFKEKLSNMETENSLLKTTVDTLNETISNQKDSIKSANEDITSYNHVIQELQIKLTQKENLLKVDINDSVLEKMIANEQQVIANNENIVNIIQCLRNALDVRNKEIAELKNKVNHDARTDNKDLLDELQTKTDHINKINIEVDDLKKQINENITLINKLMQEKSNHKIIEEELSAKLADTTSQNNDLKKINSDNALFIERLKAEIDKLTSEIDDKNNNLTKQIEELNEKVADLEIISRQKDDLISSLNKEKAESEENMLKAKTAVQKSQAIIATLSGNMQEVPEIINNFVNIFSALSDSLNTLELAATDIVTEREETTKNLNHLRTELEQLEIKHNSELIALRKQIENHTRVENGYKQETNVLSETINQLNNELRSLHDELDSKTSLNSTLETKLNEAIEIRNLEQAFSKTKQEQFEQCLLEKDTTIDNLTHKLEAIENNLKEKDILMNSFEEQFIETRKTKHDFLVNILKKVTDITENFNTETQAIEDFTDSMKIYNQIFHSLNKIADHITFINLKNAESDNNQISEILSEAKREIRELTHKNLNLEEKMFDIEKLNNELLTEIEQNQDNNRKLSLDLKGSQSVLQELQTELKMKASELALMEDKVKDWRGQFEELDDIMKVQMSELKMENENLKSRMEDLKRESELSVVIDDNKSAQMSTKISDLPPRADTNSPPSLLTICCNKIVDFIEPKESESKTTTTSSIESENNCKCDQLKSELKSATEENSRILNILAQMEVVNQHLLQEQDVVRNEIQFLVEPALELQKKIVNHRTNLSILTATTYAENKSLKSQVKVLQHHHKRFHNVCQRDIPDFKKQLNSLMSILKGDPSSCDQQNISFKRYSLPDVLDNSTALPNFKNESTLDGDLLMLDTNITLTTAADNTLTGHDQTCLDMTQYYTEASCQTHDLNQTTEQSQQQSNILDQLNILKEENIKLRDIVGKYSQLQKTTVDAQNNSIKNGDYFEEINYNILNVNDDSNHECANCKDLAALKESHDSLNKEFKKLLEELNNVMTQKTTIEEKYNSVILETPSTDALVKKLSILEKEYNSQKQEIGKLNSTISTKNRELKNLQEENDTLSNQLMENISEADSLNKDLENLKQENMQLLEKCHILEQSAQPCVDTGKTQDMNCSQCAIKDKLIQSMQYKMTNTHTKLNRSLSDSDTSSRYNKICTLQSELHAGREDCKELTEDVVTIKNHLERSNLSMDLDESLPEVNNYSFNKDFDVSSAQSNKCNMPDIPEERTRDIYVMDKIDCYNYYVEKTGAPKDTLNCDAKIIDVMKMLYENLITKHGNEVENLTNKMKDYEEAKNQLQNQYYNVLEKQEQVNRELEERNKKYADVAKILSQIRNNISIINDNLHNVTDADKAKLVNNFKDSLALLDKEFDLVSVRIFESLIDNIVNKHQTDLSGILEKYTKLQEHMETVTTELSSVNSNLVLMKNQLSAKEDEYNLLKAQKERVHEITNAVTLDIVKREKELKDTIDNGYKRLIELGIVKQHHIHSNMPLNKNITMLFELVVTQNSTSQRDKETEKETLTIELNNLRLLVEEKQNEIDLLKTRNEKSHEVNNGVTLDLIDKDNKLQALTTLYDDLNKAYEHKVEEHKANLILTEKLSEEVNVLNARIADRETNIERLENDLAVQRQRSEELAKMSEIVEFAKGLQEENTKLKSVNEMINKERDAYAEELKRSGETIKKNNIDLDKMMSDILVLRESVKENSSVIENLSAEAKSLLKQNVELKEQLEDKCKECSRLETNIKTHEKTAQIQTRMIMRLEKQKSEEEQVLSETKRQVEELSQKYAAVQKENDTWKDELEALRNAKSELEARVAELEAQMSGARARASLEGSDSARQRRRSLHDAQRVFALDQRHSGDHNGVEAVFDARPKPDDLFMDVDESVSNRSTPIRLSKGRDSLSLSRTDQSDRDEEAPSRPSSVLETRRRRQTLHDSRRGELAHTPDHSPHGDNESSTVAQLRKRLSSCQQELDELKEKYRELDEECETCAQYLKERDAQCSRLKKEKTSLQTTVAELKEKLQSCNPNTSETNASKPNVAHASVNTDEDWTNLHSLVVDRMSYNAEVEKNKKLSKTIEELRFTKHELKNALAHMQKALDKSTANRELEVTKQELVACKQELAQLKEKYRELDEECEICGQYLREREEQCRRLKDAKAKLEAKLHELQGEATAAPGAATGAAIGAGTGAGTGAAPGAAAGAAAAARRKRHSAHDAARGAAPHAPHAPHVAHAATDTGDDFLSYQVERDGNSRSRTDEKHEKEVKHLKLAVERLMQHKAALEQQLSALAPPAAAAMYVATGSAIVQNQQITDVMKENQKLKKINAKLIHMCKKRGKDSNRENEDPATATAGTR